MGEEIAQPHVRAILAAPFREMARNEIVEREHPALELLHRQRRRRDHLRQRGEIEDRVVGCDGGVGVVRETAERLAPEHLPGAADLNDCGRKGAVGDGVLEHPPGGGEAQGTRLATRASAARGLVIGTQTGRPAANAAISDTCAAIFAASLPATMGDSASRKLLSTQVRQSCR